MAVPLAAEVDIIERLGRQLTSTEAQRIGALLAGASATVRNYTGRTFTRGDITTKVRVNNGRVRLPQTPVLAVGHVKVINADGTVGGAIAGYGWDGLATLTVAAPSVVINGPDLPWDAYRVVEVLYTAGYDTIPDTVVEVVCNIVIRALGRKPDDQGLASESIDAYSYTAVPAAIAGPLGMLDEERQALDNAFPRVGGPIWTSR